MIKKSQVKIEIYFLAVFFCLNYGLDVSASAVGFRPVVEAESGRETISPTTAAVLAHFGRETPHHDCISPTTAAVAEYLGRQTPPDMVTYYGSPAVFPSQLLQTPQKKKQCRRTSRISRSSLEPEYQVRITDLMNTAHKLTRPGLYELGKKLREDYGDQKGKMDIRHAIFFTTVFKDYLMLLFREEGPLRESLSLWNDLTQAYCDLLQHSWCVLLDKTDEAQVLEYQGILMQPAALIGLTIDVRSKTLSHKEASLKHILIVIYDILQESLKATPNEDVKKGFIEPFIVLLYAQ